MKAIKHDQGKPRMDLLPAHAMFGIAEALTYGIKKYSAFNYKKEKGLNWSQVTAALLRHLFAWLGGEEVDKESGLKHLWHVGACCVMLIDLTESKIGLDDRFKK